MDIDFIKSSIESGKYYGYPECCIKAFCLATPSMLKKGIIPKKEINERYKASKMGNEYTGFIPCLRHAIQINRGIITLNSLINNRSNSALPFPMDWSKK